GNGGEVWESALPGGTGQVSWEGPSATSGKINVDTGFDTLAKLEVKDKDGNWITIEASGQTQIDGPHGTLLVEADGSWTYMLIRPVEHDNTNATGAGDQQSEMFVVRATDADGDVTDATLNIYINDDGPIATDDSAVQSAVNAPVLINVFANDARGSDGLDLATGVKLVEGTLSGNGTLVYNNDGTFTYHPAAGEEGEVTFRYQLTDADGDTDTATVTITLWENSVPVISSDGNGGEVWESALPGGTGQVSWEGRSATSGKINVDRGIDTLAKLEVKDKDGNWITIEASGQTQIDGPHGTLLVEADGSWTYMLIRPVEHDNTNATGAGDQQSEMFVVRATDADGDVTDATLNIYINDDGPIATDDSAVQSAVNAPVLINVFA